MSSGCFWRRLLGDDALGEGSSSSLIAEQPPPLGTAVEIEYDRVGPHVDP
jgi:hypothetical protein